MSLVARRPIIVTRPRLAAADESNDALSVARAALKRAIVVREHATLQVEQLRALVDRLQAERRTAGQ